MGFLDGIKKRQLAESRNLNVTTIASELYKTESKISNPSIPELDNILNRYRVLKERTDTLSMEGIKLRSTINKEKQSKEQELQMQYEVWQEEYSKIKIKCSEELREIENKQKLNLVKIQDLDREFSQAVTQHNKKYDNLLNKQSQVYKSCLNVIEEFSIEGKLEEKVTEKEASSYSVLDIFEMLKFFCDEINEVEGALTDDSKLAEYLKKLPNKIKKLNSSNQTALAITLSPIATIGGILNLVKKAMIKSKIKPIIKTIHQEVLKCKKILELQEKLIENAKIEKCPSQKEHKKRIKELEQNYQRMFLENTETTKSKYDRLLREHETKNPQFAHQSILTQLDTTSREKEDNLKQRQQANQEHFDEQVSKLKEEYKSFLEANKTLPSLIHSKQEEFSKAKLEVAKKIEEFQEYKDLCLMNFQLEIPKGEIITNQWKQCVELDNTLYKRKLELEKVMKEYEEKGITEQTFRDQYDELHSKETELFILSTTEVCLGYYDTSSYNELTNLLENPKALYRPDFKTKTICCIYKTKEQRDQLINFVKRLTLSMLSLHHTESCVVNIINPNNKPYFDDLQIDRNKIKKETKEVIKGAKYVTSYNTSEACQALAKEIKSTDLKLRSKDLATKTYEQYVKSMRDAGGKPNKYNINILVDPADSTEYDDYLDEERGILNILLVDEDTYISKSFDEQSNSLKRTISYQQHKYCYKNFYSIIESLDKDNLIITYRDKPSITINYTPISPEEIEETKTFLRERALNTRPDPLSVPDFINRVVGSSDNYFTGDVDKGVLLYIGYQDGDRDRATPVYLDEGSKPFMLICGTTGGGKSVTLSVIVNTLKTLYSPVDLELVYIDLKVVEVAIHATPNKMPQASVLSGTLSEEYLLSVTDYVVDEMLRRLQLFEASGVKQFSSYRELQRKQKAKLMEELEKAKNEGNTELAEQKQKEIDNIVPMKRLVFLIDEVAQAWGPIMSDEGKQHFTRQVLRLSQQARATGINMVFVTQDITAMNGDIVNLFAQRGCTVAPKNISQNALRNDFASRPENQFLGFFGTNDMGGAEEGNRQYVVPFSPESYTKQLTKVVCNLCESKGIPQQNAIIFSDTEEYNIELFNRYQNEHQDDLNGYNIMFGEQAKFMREFKPYTLNFEVDDQQSLLVYSISTQERMDIAKLMFQSLKDKACVFPVFAKTLYKELLPSYFYSGLRKQEEILPDWFCAGKDLVKTDTALKMAEQWSICQFEQNDLFDPEGKGLQPSDEKYKSLASANSELLLEYTILDYIDIHKEIKESGDTYIPKYFFIFDMDKHPSFINNAYQSWKKWSEIARSASSAGIYLIFFSNNVEKYWDNNVCGFYLGSKTNGIVIPRALRKETPMAYLYDKQLKQNAVFKVPRVISDL